MTIEELVKSLRGVDHMSVEDCYWQSPLFGHAADKLEELAAENEKLKAVRRWSLDEVDDTLYVCRDEHSKGDPCEWEPYAPKAALAEKDKEIEALRDRMEKAEASVSAEMDGMYGHDAGGVDA